MVGLWVSAAASRSRAAAEGIQLGGLTLLSGVLTPLAFFTSSSSQFPSSSGCVSVLQSLWAPGAVVAVPRCPLQASCVSCPGHAGVGAGGLQTRSRVWHSPRRGSIQQSCSKGHLCRVCCGFQQLSPAQHLPSVGWGCAVTLTHTANLLISKIHLMLFLPMGVGRYIARNFQLH